MTLLGPKQTRCGTTFYSLADSPTLEEMEALGLGRHLSPYGVTVNQERRVVAVKTGAVRPPRRGEWFISGAVPQAYKALNDLSGVYDVAVLRVARRLSEYALEPGVQDRRACKEG